MTQKTSPKQEKFLNEAELELKSILWKLGEGSVNDVLAHLPAGRDLAYTSVSTILRILEQRGAVSSRKEGRGHIYLPALAKEQYETTTLHHVVSKVFDGAPTTLVRRLLEANDLTQDELKSIRALLNEKLD